MNTTNQYFRSVNIERNQCKVCGSERHFYPDGIVCDTCESNRHAQLVNTKSIQLTGEEMILVRDAMLDMKHNLKSAPSERGQRLCKLSETIAKQLDNQINNRRF